MSHGQERNLIIACKFAQMLVFFNKVSMFCYNISEPVYIWMFLGALPNSLKRVLWAKLRSHVFLNSKKNILQKEVIHTYLSN